MAHALFKARGMMIRKFIVLVLSTVFLWTLGFVWFIASVPNKRTTDLRQTDAIVVLTGGSERLGAGLALLTNGYAAQMFVSGVGKGATVEDLFDIKEFAPEKAMFLKQRISLGYSADDTYENGMEVARWVRENHHRSIRLVTSNYHLPRSMQVLKAELPDVEIISNPVFPHSVKTGEWWNYSGTRQLLISEYTKFVAVFFRNLVGWKKQ